MSATELQLAIECVCSIWAVDDNKVRRCDEHHKYWLKDKELASVSSVLRVWPQEPCSQCKWPMFSDHVEGCSVKANVDHAHERGIRTDRYAQEYVRTGMVRIPAGEWMEVRNLAEKVVAWLQERPDTKTQVIVHDYEVAGTLDFLVNNGVSLCISDLKCTYDLSFNNRLQVGGYLDLIQHSHGYTPEHAGLLHVTERFKQARYVPLDVQECIQSWRTVRAFWKLYKEQA